MTLWNVSFVLRSTEYVLKTDSQIITFCFIPAEHAILTYCGIGGCFAFCYFPGENVAAKIQFGHINWPKQPAQSLVSNTQWSEVKLWWSEALIPENLEPKKTHNLRLLAGVQQPYSALTASTVKSRILLSSTSHYITSTHRFLTGFSFNTLMPLTMCCLVPMRQISSSSSVFV